MTLSTLEVARRLGCSPVDVTQVFYRRQLPDNLAPIERGRRQIPEEALPQIKEALAAAVKLPETVTAI